ncbi:DUF2188 domain-containing protein [Phenylobacterium soli]|uniref:DUF2188 domain-containing protein n=1 Tax=Phenylobacterium soli TaxID=2170551 RepID=A0A328AR54_9CAUL|nr:DUF2188 domain-containing protein [Phenylobacterium soli]RAK55994.1 hypothetical protein DJ017_16480 [Phenylobacterium soli]
MTRILAVRPAAFGWSLRIDAQDGFQVFTTGAQAEAAARRLAHRLADAGEPAEVLIYLRDGSLAGRLRATPRAPAVAA